MDIAKKLILSFSKLSFYKLNNIYFCGIYLYLYEIYIYIWYVPCDIFDIWYFLFKSKRASGVNLQADSIDYK